MPSLTKPCLRQAWRKATRASIRKGTVAKAIRTV